MARREERKPKDPKPKEQVSLSPSQKKEKLRRDVVDAFRRAFGHEDVAPIPNQRSK
jgi:hypothetical protein